MKIIFLTTLLLPFYIFSNNLVRWKEYKKNINKPVFMLLTDTPNNKTDKKIFSNPRLAKLLNEKFYPIKIDVTKEPEFKNRYLLMTPPSIAILDKNGIIITKKRNYSTLTIERDLYNYLESLKNKSIRKMLNKISHRAMHSIYYPSYFLKNTKELINRSKNISDFIIKEINTDKMFFNTPFMKPLYDYSFSVLSTKSNTYEKLIASAHIDSLIESKMFDKDHVFKGAYNHWSKPLKKIIYKDNIKLLELLLMLGNKEYALKIDHYLSENYKKLNNEEKLLYKSVAGQYLTKNTPSELTDLVNKNKDSKYLTTQTAIFKAYLTMYQHQGSIKNELIKFVDNMENNFYDIEKGVFYDVKKNTEPFGFKFVDIIVNIELAYLYTKLYEITKDFNYLITTKYILSFMNTTSIDNLIYSKYLIAIENLTKLEKEIINKTK